MTKYICAYCREPIKRDEEGVFDRLSEKYFHNADGCPFRDRDLPKLPEISDVNGGVTCFNLYNMVNFEDVLFDLVPLTELDHLSKE